MVPAITQVLIYSRFALHRAAWRALLEDQPGISFLGSAGCLEEFAPFSRTEGPLALLVDEPEVQPDVVIRMHAALPECGLLFLIQEDRLEDVVALLKAGATGFVSRNQPGGELARALIASGRGELVLPAQIAMRSLLYLAGQASPQGPLEPLTARENDVLSLLSQGLTNKDIAQALFLSVRTVEAHLRTIYGKVGVRSRTEAALWAVRQGYGKGN